MQISFVLIEIYAWRALWRPPFLAFADDYDDDYDDDGDGNDDEILHVHV